MGILSKLERMDYTFSPLNVYNFSMSNALTLYRIQQIDSRLDQIQARLQTIHAALSESAEVKAARERIEQTQADLHTIERALKQAEIDAQAQRIKLDQAEASLYGGSIKNPKELKDLEKDVASLKRRMQELEDIQLDMMLKAESAREALQKAQSEHNAIQGKIISQNATLQTEQETLHKERETVRSRRTAAVSGVDAPSLTLYESLREKRSGIAVATVSDNSCDVCGASMTPGHAQSVRTSSQLVHCPMCGRILYSH
jgi:predicted  nucleic acid-binding Zn-ribbon protein